MADNVEAASGSGGPDFATAEITFSGDTVHSPVNIVGLLTGSEGAYTFSLLVGGAGAVAAGVQRVTLASDDPAVAKLGTIDTDTGNIATSTAALAAALKIDDAAFTPATDAVLPVGAMFDDSGPDSVNEGDIGVPRMSSRREIYLQIRDAAGNERGANVDKSGNLLVVATQSSSWSHEVSGPYAHDVTPSTIEPILVGGVASLSAPTDVTNGNVAKAWFLQNGSQVANLAVGGTLVTGSAGLPVAQQGTFTVDLGATDNAVLDAIAASVAAGATAANQSTLIGHVDGLEGLLTTIDADTGNIVTAVQLLDNAVVVLGTATYTEATSSGYAIGAVRRDADTTLVDTTNEWGPLQMDANGRLKVEAFSGETLPVSLTSTTITGTVAATQSGTWDEVGIHDSGNSITVDYATTGSGNATGALRVELANNGTGVIATVGAVTAITNALPAGTNGIGKLTANSGVDIGDVDVTSISAGTNAIGNVGLIGRTTGGMTIFRSLDIDETEEEIKNAAGQVFNITAFNRTATPLFLKFYNATAANVTVGSTTPVLTFLVPANADSDGAGFIWNSDIGYAFGTAITVACTTGIADADTGAPGANDCLINVGYV